MVQQTALDIDSKRILQRVTTALVSAVMAVSFAGCATFNQFQSEPFTVPQIIASAKEGMPADAIIGKMKASGMVYRLKATQLTKLQNEGVPGKVIDYMQQTYLDAVKQDSRYNDWQYWTMDDEYWYGGHPYGWPDFE